MRDDHLLYNSKTYDVNIEAHGNLSNSNKYNSIKSRSMQRSKRCGLLGLTTGIVFGFLLCFWSKPLPCITQSECCLRQQLREEIRHEMSLSQPSHGNSKQRKQVLIGVMTAADFIDTRAMGVWRTWAKNINGDVVFFSSEKTPQRYGLPIVALPGVDDSYPPQKKSFMLVKYLHDFGLEKYDYFMRVDDDVYIHGDRLSNFLSQLNNSEPLFIGQAGLGNSQEFGQLSLGRDENFCMGGPGIIFSAETLRRMVPHINYCLQNLRTTHEDVELGRCVRMFAGVPCTWNYEVQKLFYHSYTYKTEKNVFPYEFSKAPMDEAITLHPVKTPDLMYKVHQEIYIRETAKKESRRLQLEKEIRNLNKRIDSDDGDVFTTAVGPAISKEDTASWTFITKKCQYDHTTFSVKRNLFIQWKHLLSGALAFVKENINKKLAADGLATEQGLMDLVSGYRRVDPVKGVQLVLNLKIDYKRFRKGFSVTPPHKTVVLNMPFSQIQLREVSYDPEEVVHFILPLKSRFKTFQRFLKQFELICGRQDLKCDLILILYDGPEATQTKLAMENSQYKQKITILSGEGDFSRAKALHKGLLTLPEEALMLFIDVDMSFNDDAILRIRQHTIKDKQAYFPIVFSQYDSQMVCGLDVCPVNEQSSDAGAFRFFGFGITSMYKTDYLKCGGFDMSIQGWGKEDVDLYLKVIRCNLSVFRAADPGFVHIYHPVICEKSLSREQNTMCLNSKSASFASKHTLAEVFSITHAEIMHR